MYLEVDVKNDIMAWRWATILVTNVWGITNTHKVKYLSPSHIPVHYYMWYYWFLP